MSQEELRSWQKRPEAGPWASSHQHRRFLYLRLLDRGRRQGECRPSSSVTLSVLRKCLERKCSSSGVGWYGSWCSRSWEDEDDCKEGRTRSRRSGDGSVPGKQQTLRENTPRAS